MPIAGGIHLFRLTRTAYGLASGSESAAQFRWRWPVRKLTMIC
jgi:hypothetical protein